MRHLFASQSIEDKFHEVCVANLQYALQNDALRNANDELRYENRYLRNAKISKLLKQNKKLKHSIHKAYTKYIKKEEPQLKFHGLSDRYIFDHERPRISKRYFQLSKEHRNKFLYDVTSLALVRMNTQHLSNPDGSMYGWAMLDELLKKNYDNN
jgi:hypothetical protein